MHTLLHTYRQNSFTVREHQFSIPLEHNQPSGPQISVFARELTQNEQLPWLVFFQGGPGFPAIKPTNSGWIKAASAHFRILLLDQRGTGRSSALHAASFNGLTPNETATYLSHFRADSIVKDAEFIRQALGIKQWSTLGQSFGGFCTLSYLSMFPESLQQCFVTGGMAGIHRSSDEIYQACYQELARKNEQFFAQYPHAQQLCSEIAEYLTQHQVTFSNGQIFSVEQFQALGICLGTGAGKEVLYGIIEDAFTFDHLGQKILNPTFIQRVYSLQAFNSNPIYAILHEAIYSEASATNWSAQRVQDQATGFNWRHNTPFLFTGEMVLPSVFKELKALQPLAEAAQILATKSDWNPLYDCEQLANNRVPVFCAIYNHDMYVPLEFSRETVSKMGNVKAWYTSEYEHDGLSVDGELIFNTLLNLR